MEHIRTSPHSPTHTHRGRLALTACALSILGFVAASCGSDSKSTVGTSASASVTVTGQWARTTAAGAVNGAVYLTITSPVADSLTAASVDATVAAKVEIHETVMASTMDTSSMGTTAMGTTAMGTATTMMGTATTVGQMTMKPVASVELKAGVATEFKPGGYHIMLFGLVKPLTKGETIKVTLTLTKAGTITVDVPVLDEAP
jgi:hypothetical protein